MIEKTKNTKGLGKDSREHLAFLNSDKKYSFLDLRGTPFDKNQLDQIIELALGFSITGKPFNNQINEFTEHLTGEKLNEEGKLQEEISKKVNSLIKNPSEDKSTQIYSEIIQQRTLNKMQESILEQFIGVMGDEIEDIKGDRKKKTKVDFLQTELQKRGVEKITKGLKDAIDYWQNILKLPLPQNTNKNELINEKIVRILKSQNLKNQLKRIYTLFSRLQGNEKGCEFLKVVIAVVKAKQMEFAELEKQTEQFEHELLFNRADKFHVDLEEKEWKTLIKKISRGIYVEVSQATRSKSLHRRVTKLLNNSKFDPQQAINDGIGLRFEVKNKEDAIALIQDFLGQGGVLHKMGHSFKLRTRNLLNKEFSSAKILKSGTELPVCFDSVETDPSDSSDFFEDARIIGETNDRAKFEIQFVLVGNTNESGLSHHGIWDQMGIAAAKARISGYITPDELDIYVEEAYKNSLTKEDIKEIKENLQLEYTQKNSDKKMSSSQLKGAWRRWVIKRKKDIKKRFLSRAIEFEEGKYIYSEPKYRFKHRLIGTGLLSPEEDQNLRDTCFDKWLYSTDGLSKYFVDGTIHLHDPADPASLIPYKVNSVENLPTTIINDIRRRWERENDEDNIVFEFIEDTYVFEKRKYEERRTLEQVRVEKYAKIMREINKS